VGRKQTSAQPATVEECEVADLATYVRKSCAIGASPVATLEVASLRRKLGLDALRLTGNSGDRP